MKIEFITGPNGKAIPAQHIKIVYRLRGPDETKGHDERLEKVDMPDLFTTDIGLYVNHFETCPHADEFHKND